MDTVRLVDFLLTRPSMPLALADRDLEGWELVETPDPRESPDPPAA